MSFESDLLSKAEQAAAAYLVAKRVTDSLDPVNTFTGQNAGNKSLPEIIVEAEGPGEPEQGLEFTGNFWFNFNCIVRTSAAVDVGSTDTAVKTANDDLVKWAFDSMMMDDITDQLSSAGSNFTCIALVPQSPNYQPEEENAFSNILSFRMYACCTDL